MTMYKCNSSLFCRSVWVPCLTIFMYVIQAINCLKKELLQIIINFIVRRGGWRSWGIIKILIFGWRYNCLQKVWVVIYSKLKDPKIGTFIFWKSLGGGDRPRCPPHRHAPASKLEINEYFIIWEIEKGSAKSRSAFEYDNNINLFLYYLY